MRNHLRTCLAMICLVSITTLIRAEDEAKPTTKEEPFSMLLRRNQTGLTDPRCVAFSPDGKRFVSGGLNETVIVWDTATQTPVLELKGHSGTIISVGFSPDGKRVVSSARSGLDDAELIVWDAATGQLLRTIKEDTEEIRSATFSPDGKRIAAVMNERIAIINGNAGRRGQYLRIWNAETGRRLQTIELGTDRISRVVFSPDGKHFVTASGYASEDYDFAADAVRDQPIQDAADNPRPTGHVKIWNAATGQMVLDVPMKRMAPNDVAFSPDGKRIVCALSVLYWQTIVRLHHDTDIELRRYGSSIVMLDSMTGKTIFSTDEEKGLVASVAFSPDGQFIVSGNHDEGSFQNSGGRGLKVRDAASGKEIRTIKTRLGITSLAISPEGKHWLVTFPGELGLRKSEP